MQDTITRNLQETELKMLKKVSAIFQENNIEFFLACGTALGCVRHKGFIPWDDDVDLYFHGKDYNRIKDLFSNGPIDDLMFQDYSTVPGYPYPFPKIINVNSILIEKSLQHLPYNCGVYIDLFPLAEVSNNQVVRNVEEKLRYFRYCLLKSYYFSFSGPKRGLNYLARHIVNPNRIQSRLQSMYMALYENTNYVVDTGTFGKQAILCAKDFDDTIMMPFENVPMPMPCGYKDYLTGYYGEYMKLPPEGQRLPRHQIYALIIEGKRVI